MPQKLRALAALLAAFFVASVAMAQEEPAASGLPVPSLETLEAVTEAAEQPAIPGIDLDAWTALAARTEATIDEGGAEDAALETLRSQISDYRRQFLDAQTTNSARIDTLRSQISALGTPAEGQEEAPEVAARRAELELQLSRARVPVLAAEEAYNRAQGLITEIDTIIRGRQTDELLELGPSPLNPSLWPDALSGLSRSVVAVGREVSDASALPSRRQEFLQQIPAVLFFLSVAFILLVRGREWAASAGEWILERSPRGGRVWSSLVSLGQIILPLIGIAALVEAVQVSGLLGTRGAILLDWLPIWALMILGARWVADRVFSAHDGMRLLPMERPARQEARVYAAIFAALAVLRHALEVIADFDGYSDAMRAVIDFPIMVIMAIILFRFGRILTKQTVFEVGIDPITGEERPLPMRARFVGIIGRAAAIIAFVAPVLAVVGYGAAARGLIYPAVNTLLIAGLVLLLQRFASDLYRFVARQEDSEDDSLITVLIGFLLTIAAIPPLSLIWGARVADLTELWTRIGEGFTFGETRIQPTDFIAFVVIFAALYTATRILQSALRNSILPKTRLDAGGQNAIVSGTGYIGIFLAALIAISATGLDLSSLAIVAGALSVGIGFGLQNIVSNFVSGIILLIERPIAEGDWIEVGGNMGYVRGISVRSTRIQTFDRTDVIVPNADLVSGTVTNFTRGNTIGRVIVPVGVAYGTDTRKVEDILMSIARQHDMVLLNPEPSVVFQGFGADSMDFEIRAILRDVNWVLSVKSDMNHEIARRFAEEGIEIPFAQRDVWLRNPDALTKAPQQQPPTEMVRKTQLDEDDLDGDISADHPDASPDDSGETT